MATFRLKIVTPDGLQFDGEATELSVRATSGQVGILARHTDFVTPLGLGEATIVTESGTRKAACIGGMLSVLDGKVTLVPTTFEWADQIDAARADASYERAQKVLHKKDATSQEIRMAEARLKRALIRKSVAQQSR